MKLKLVALFSALATSAFAQIIINTGLNNVDAFAAQDDNWFVTGPGANNLGFIVQPDGFPLPNPWFVGPASSVWLSPNNLNAGGDSSQPLSPFVWTRTFTIGSAAEAAIAALTFKTASDNQILAASLNGSAITTPNSGNQFLGFSPEVVVGGGFIVGVNTLSITVFNSTDNVGPDNQLNPSGLRVEGVVTFNAVPEPSTYGALAAGVLIAGVWLKRRRSKA